MGPTAMISLAMCSLPCEGTEATMEGVTCASYLDTYRSRMSLRVDSDRLKKLDAKWNFLGLKGPVASEM